jgi:hypothetical protein
MSQDKSTDHASTPTRRATDKPAPRRRRDDLSAGAEEAFKVLRAACQRQARLSALRDSTPAKKKQARAHLQLVIGRKRTA